MSIYKYEDKLEIILNDKKEICNIKCELPVLGKGNDRIVYDLGDNKVLKVANHIDGSLINYEEVALYENMKDKDWFIRVPKVFDCEKDYALWIVVERIDMTESDMAMNIALKYIPILDEGENAGFSKDGDIVIVDSENVGLNWYLKSENPLYAKYHKEE